jgi:hypothetical protein
MKFNQQRLGLRVTAVCAGIAMGWVSAAAIAGERLERERIATPSSRVQVFVRLSTPAVSELNAQSIEATGTMASVAAQRAQAEKVSAEQSAFRQQLASTDAEEVGAMRVGANGLRLNISADQVETLAAMTGVLSVGRVETHSMDNTESVPWIGAVRAAQNLGLTGRGVTVGIIDSGIDYLHANFRADGFPGNLSAGGILRAPLTTPETLPLCPCRTRIRWMAMATVRTLLVPRLALV